MTSASARPRLYWAYSHQTLVRSEPEILEQAGFEVTVEDPERFTLRESSFVDYPVDLGSVNTRRGSSLSAPQFRFSARGGQVSPEEVRWANTHLDAILISGPLRHAANIAEWFEGSVLYRWFGSPESGEWGVKSESWPVPTRSISSRMIAVPAFSGLLETVPHSLFDHKSLLRVEVPPLARKSTLPAERPTVGVFVGYVGNDYWVAEWLQELAEKLDGWRIRIFAASPLLCRRLQGSEAEFEILPRLSDAQYWEKFQQCSIIVYPHEYKYHSHYIPLEAIQMGIPAVVSSKGAFALENGLNGLGQDEAGVYASRESMLSAVIRLTRDESARGDLIQGQRKLLVPFDRDTVVAQAEHLASMVLAGDVTRTERRRRDVSGAVGIPTNRPLIEALRGGFDGKLTLAPATIVEPIRVQYAEPLNAVLRPGPDGLITEVSATGAGDFDLSVGALAVDSDTTMCVRLEMDSQGVGPAPCRIEYGHRIYPMVREEGSAATWTCAFESRPDSLLKIRMVGALIEQWLRIRSLTVSAGVAGCHAIEQLGEFNGGRSVSVSTFAQTARMPKKLGWLRNWDWAAVRVPLPFAHESQITIRATTSTKSGFGMVVAGVRRGGSRRVAPLGLFVGSFGFSRALDVGRGDVPLALGHVAALARLRFTRCLG